jgi:DNA-binding NarL/FixJ family response regulator
MAKIKVVLADKNLIFCEGLAKLLEREPDFNVVCTCHTGLEAIQKVDEHQADVILIDIGLVECSGLEAIRRIHERLPSTNIVVLTHSESDADLIAAIRSGARAYISKDVNPEELIKVVTLVANGEVVVSPPMATKLLAEINLLEENKGLAKEGGVSLVSKREKEVVSLVAQGLTNRKIAETLFISEHTVKVHLRNIMEKFHAHTREQAVALAREKSVIQ